MLVTSGSVPLTSAQPHCTTCVSAAVCQAVRARLCRPSRTRHTPGMWASGQGEFTEPALWRKRQKACQPWLPAPNGMQSTGQRVACGRQRPDSSASSSAAAMQSFTLLLLCRGWRNRACSSSRCRLQRRPQWWALLHGWGPVIEWHQQQRRQGVSHAAQRARTAKINEARG